MSWDKFINAGFSRSSERIQASKDLLRYGAVLEATDDDLEVKWYTQDGLRFYTVACRCGNNRMLYHEGGIRCHICGRFHSHDNFQKQSTKARQAAKFHDAKIERIPQPMAAQSHKTASSRSRGNTQRHGTARLGIGPV